MRSLAILLFTLGAAFIFAGRYHRPAPAEEPNFATQDVSGNSMTAPAVSRSEELSHLKTSREPERKGKISPPSGTRPLTAETVVEVPQSILKIELARNAEIDLASAGCTFNSRKLEGTANAVIDNELTCANTGRPEIQRAALQKYISDLTAALKEATPGEDNSVIYNKAANAGDALATMALSGIARDDAVEENGEY